MADIIKIKRYPNRRFYNLAASKYISQEEIEKLVIDGNKVEIQDNQTGEDITRSILTRIILERQPDKMLLFPTDMLHFILRANDVSTGFLRDYFRHSLTYLDYLSNHTPATPLARPMHWVKAWLDSMVPHPTEGDGQAAEELVEDDAARLARRVEELEARIQQLEGH